MMSGGFGQTSSSRSLESIFISHASEDKDFVHTLAENLRQKGFDAWHQQQMAVGGQYMSEIDARLDRCKAGIVVWSRFSVTSDYVKAEANRLRVRECLVPVYIEDCKPPAVFDLIHGVMCRNERSLTTEEIDGLCDAIGKLSSLEVRAKFYQSPHVIERQRYDPKWRTHWRRYMFSSFSSESCWGRCLLTQFFSGFSLLRPPTWMAS